MNSPSAEPVPNTDAGEQVDHRQVWTVPNIICLFRMIGSLVLIAIAIVGSRYWFIGIYVVLCVSDWVDGKYARMMNQRSPLGARLDSIADAFLNACLLVGVLILYWEILKSELVLLGAGIVSYLTSSLVALAKYRRLPAYHAYSAKLAQVLTMIAAVSLVLNWSVWPLRLTALAVILTNLETLAITCVLSQWRADVRSFFHVWPRQDGSGD